MYLVTSLDFCILKCYSLFLHMYVCTFELLQGKVLYTFILFFWWPLNHYLYAKTKTSIFPRGSIKKLRIMFSRYYMQSDLCDSIFNCTRLSYSWRERSSRTMVKRCPPKPPKNRLNIKLYIHRYIRLIRSNSSPGELINSLTLHTFILLTLWCTCLVWRYITGRTTGSWEMKPFNWLLPGLVVAMLCIHYFSTATVFSLFMICVHLNFNLQDLSPTFLKFWSECFRISRPFEIIVYRPLWWTRI